LSNRPRHRRLPRAVWQPGGVSLPCARP